jgi:hypothetical protein
MPLRYCRKASMHGESDLFIGVAIDASLVVNMLDLRNYHISDNR